MRTVTICIGNSDDLLTQSEWAKYYAEVQRAVRGNASTLYFSGGSAISDPWQNAAFVFECEEKIVTRLRNELSLIRQGYQQDSIAWVDGKTFSI